MKQTRTRLASAASTVGLSLAWGSSAYADSPVELPTQFDISVQPTQLPLFDVYFVYGFGTSFVEFSGITKIADEIQVGAPFTTTVVPDLGSYLIPTNNEGVPYGQWYIAGHYGPGEGVSITLDDSRASDALNLSWTFADTFGDQPTELEVIGALENGLDLPLFDLLNFNYFSLPDFFDGSAQMISFSTAADNGSATVSAAAIPEPQTMALALGLMAGAILLVRCFRHG